MSQSNAYRFFPSKGALMAAVAERWFGDIEKALAVIAEGSDPPGEKLRRFALSQLRMKRDRFDEDPDLFRAYLKLGEENMDVVLRHVERISALLQKIIVAWLADEKLDPGAADEARILYETATVQFRDPNLIARHRATSDDAHADAVIATLMAGLRVRYAGQHALD